jgi:hypothetical protein
MLEEYGFLLLVLGAALAAAAWVWLVVRGFKERKLWGLALVFFPPAALWFIARHFAKAWAPLLLLLLAGLVAATPYGLSYYQSHFVALKPYEQIVDGERRITLTGLKDFDYSTLQNSRDTVVLQMANDDVDDGTLEYLKGMDRLRALDLNDTRVTDAGLRTLAELPALQELRLARTKITDEGFKKYLGSKQSLRKLDLTGTEVKGKTKRDWKKLDPENREYVD